MPLSYYAEFFTATILKWQPLLLDDAYKGIVADSLAWLTKEKRCTVFAFVIMPNHIHLIWKINDDFNRSEVQGALLSYTAHQFKKHLKATAPQGLQKYYVADADRTYQFWERNPKVKECWSRPYFLQKFHYLHYNPCQPQWNLAVVPEEYSWSSASFYETGDERFPWLRHTKRSVQCLFSTQKKVNLLYEDENKESHNKEESSEELYGKCGFEQ